jgi:hypothetical protein
VDGLGFSKRIVQSCILVVRVVVTVYFHLAVAAFLLVAVFSLHVGPFVFFNGLLGRLVRRKLNLSKCARTASRRQFTWE